VDTATSGREDRVMRFPTLLGLLAGLTAAPEERSLAGEPHAVLGHELERQPGGLLGNDPERQPVGLLGADLERQPMGLLGADLGRLPFGLLVDDLERQPFGLLDNGSFDLPGREGRVPYWVGHGAEVDGSGVLRLAAGGRLRQPVAAWAPETSRTVVRGRVVAGEARVVVLDGTGRRLERAVSGSFTWEVGREAAEAGAALVPRLELVLEADAPAGLDDLEVAVFLPAPSKDQLRDLVQGELGAILDWWKDRGADRQGPLETRFAASLWDVITGEPLIPLPGWYSAYADLLLRAAVHDETRRAHAEGLLDDILTLATHPETGLPRKVSCITDQPLDAVAVEVWLQLQFLVELCEGRYHARGDQRERARALLDRAMAVVLARAPQPSGALSARFLPTGEPVPGASQLRSLDVAAAIARWVRLTGTPQPAARAALGDALREFLWDHAWMGEWDSIDPGFDDSFGHFGRRGLDLWRAFPEDPSMARLTRTGVEYYLPRWRDALRLGGNVAADQTRCWDILARVARQEPALLPQVAPLLGEAARVHFKGEQLGDGSWSDVTVNGFDPRGQLQVGDTGGVPQNALYGLALLHEADLAEAGGLALAEVRALFTTVLLSTRARDRRPYGYLWGREELPAGNRSGASLLVGVGLIEMLDRLAD
jgi:hypothetical protein